MNTTEPSENTDLALLRRLSDLTGVPTKGASSKRRALADVLRQVAGHVAGLSEGTDDDLLLERLTALLATLSMSSAHTTTRFPVPLDFYPLGSHPIVGPANAIAPPLELTLERDSVLLQGSFGPLHEGYPNTVYGGSIASAFDVTVGFAAALSGEPVMATELSVRFVAPVPINAPVHFKAWIESESARDIIAVGELTVESDRAVANARGSFRRVHWRHHRH